MTSGPIASPRLLPSSLLRLLPPLLCAALVGACGTATKRGGYYQNDGPPERPQPADAAEAPDVVPRVEPLNPRANRPYTALGRTYTPLTEDVPFRQKGQASWYGKQFHGNRTASGEIYDMYGMTAAHPTLPIPSYARVTNPRNGRSVIVRVNDRGPFKEDRVIDLSYSAATRLGLVASGTGEVEVERLTSTQIASGEWRRGADARGATTGSAASSGSAPAPGAGSASAGPSTVAPASAPATASAPTNAAALPTPPLASTLAPSTGRWSVQVGAFAQQANAEELAARVATVLGFSEGDLAAGQREARVERDENLFRVLVGALPDRAAALLLAQQLERLLGRPAVPFAR